MKAHRTYVSWLARPAGSSRIANITCVGEDHFLWEAFRAWISNHALRTFPSNQTRKACTSQKTLESSLALWTRKSGESPIPWKSHNPFLSFDPWGRIQTGQPWAPAHSFDPSRSLLSFDEQVLWRVQILEGSWRSLEALLALVSFLTSQ